MSVIQQIRDKYARWAVIAIVLSLLGFILMDAFAGRSNLFSGPSDSIGKVNGEKIDARAFDQRYRQQEALAQQQGYNVNNDATRQQLMDAVWNQQVTDLLMEEEYEELGLTVSDRELRDMLYGATPPAFLAQQFTDPSTGQYNAALAQQQLNALLRSGTPEQREALGQEIERMEDERLMQKYTALLANTTYVPDWFLERQNVDNSLIARIGYVSVPYTTVSDTAVTVTDAEIQAYIKEHENDFRQEQEMRSVKYVAFPVTPSATDSAEARNALLQLKPGFDSTTNYSAFIAQNSGTYYEGFINGDDIQNPNKDSILAAPAGLVYGPYLDGGSFAMSKIIASRSIPDTVKVRHILVATQGQQGPVRTDSAARNLIDSIQQLHRAGTSFDSLVLQYSEDPGSRDNGGVYDNVTSGKMVPPFNDFIFTNATGTTGIVKTDYGYHYVEILSQKGASNGYKIAYLFREIVPSQETETTAENAASTFAANVSDEKSFDAYVDKNLKPRGIQPLVGEVRPMDYTIAGAGSRALVKQIFDADRGAVVGPVNAENNYIVAIVTGISEPGLASVATVRPYVEPLLRNQKKAELLKTRIGSYTTLEEVSAKMGQPVQTVDSLSFSGSGNNPLSFEFKVIGAAFNPANKGKVVPQPLAGQSGVYVIRVDATGTTPVLAGSLAEQRQMLEMQARQRYASAPPTDVLRRMATIKDNRGEFY